MSHSCPACGHVQPLDVARVPAGGILVCCEQCFHFARVLPPRGGTPPANPYPASLLIRSPDAPKAWRCGDLFTMERWIREGRVLPDDLASHDEVVWTPIRRIPDLAKLFPAEELAATTDKAGPPRQTAAFALVNADPPAASQAVSTVMFSPAEMDEARGTSAPPGRPGTATSSSSRPERAGRVSAPPGVSQGARPRATGPLVPGRGTASGPAPTPAGDIGPTGTLAFSADELVAARTSRAADVGQSRVAERPVRPTPAERPVRPTPAQRPPPPQAAKAPRRVASDTPPSLGTLSGPAAGDEASEAIGALWEELEPRRERSFLVAGLLVGAACALLVIAFIMLRPDPAAAPVDQQAPARAASDGRVAEPPAPAAEPGEPTPPAEAAEPAQGPGPLAEPTVDGEAHGVDGTDAPAPSAAAPTPAPAAPAARPRSSAPAPALRPTPAPAPAPPPAPAAAPSGYQGLVSAGRAAMERRDHETALRHFVEASRANSGHPDAHMGMAEAMRAMGRLAAARATLEQYLRENARYAPAWLLLGQIRAQEGRREEAREAFERVIEVAPTGASARRARQELERL